jgi:hypothetical protein
MREKSLVNTPPQKSTSPVSWVAQPRKNMSPAPPWESGASAPHLSLVIDVGFSPRDLFVIA